ncbi:MAG: hypothetical protein HN564_06605 [Flavobacteriales bacterium]|nr:hypothetical protein [Flavobacteriales bacterium]
MKKLLLIFLCFPIVGCGDIRMYIGDCVNGYGTYSITILFSTVPSS